MTLPARIETEIETSTMTFGWWVPKGETPVKRIAHSHTGTPVEFQDFEKGADCARCGLVYYHPAYRHVTRWVSVFFGLKPWDDLPTTRDFKDLRVRMIVLDIERHAAGCGQSANFRRLEPIDSDPYDHPYIEGNNL